MKVGSSSVHWVPLLRLASLALGLYSAPAHAEDARPARMYPSLPWLLLQFVPSPQVGFGTGSVSTGLTWQVTPVLYSFGIHRRLSPWRFLMVEPIVRHSGSIELSLNPEYWFDDHDTHRFVDFRATVRSYFPLHHRGEFASASLATSFVRYGSSHSVGYELGTYVLFGTVGLNVAYLPGLDDHRFTACLALRHF